MTNNVTDTNVGKMTEQGKVVEQKKQRCDGCNKAFIKRASDGFEFTGCHHKPYRGKWVGEIKICPKTKRRDEE